MLKNLACLQPTLDNLYYPPNNGDYVYFESTPEFQFPLSSWAADAAMLAYARYQKIRMDGDELNSILDPHFTTSGTIGDCFVDNASTGRGFFAGNDNFAILAFRGTEKDNNYDIMADVDTLPVSEAALGGQSAGRVRQGVQRYLRSVWPRVKQLIDEYRVNHKTQEICITGHSLGAAVATLAFHQLQDEHTSLYTFGCPRVGDRAFCRSLESMASTRPVYRFIDNDDVVTHVPPPGGLAGYQHPNCTTFTINSLGKIERDRADPPVAEDLVLAFLKGTIVDPIPGPVADHSPVRYCHWISLKADPVLQEVDSAAIRRLSRLNTVPPTITERIVEAQGEVLKLQDVVLKANEQAKTDPAAQQKAKGAERKLKEAQQAAAEASAKQAAAGPEAFNFVPQEQRQHLMNLVSAFYQDVKKEAKNASAWEVTLVSSITTLGLMGSIFSILHWYTPAAITSALVVVATGVPKLFPVHQRAVYYRTLTKSELFAHRESSNSLSDEPWGI